MAASFRLARVLRLRTQLRRRVQDEVALLGADLAAVRSRIADARHAQEAVLTEVEEALRGAGATGAEVARWGTWGQALAAREAGLAVEGEHLAAAILRGREELVARRQEERKLERLRERAAVRAQAEDIRQEALLLDDLALRRGDGKGSGR